MRISTPIHRPKGNDHPRITSILLLLGFLHCRAFLRRPFICQQRIHLPSNQMRVIGGTYRSRRLIAPRGLATRPSSDRLRETLFNILAPRIEGAVFTDLYAGSGAVGIEALSRGASLVYFVDQAAPAVAAIRDNLVCAGDPLWPSRLSPAASRPPCAASLLPTRAATLFFWIHRTLLPANTTTPSRALANRRIPCSNPVVSWWPNTAAK